MLYGVLFGVVACMIWGTVYVAPQILAAYEPATIALARYLVFGILSLGLAYTQRHEFSFYTRADWRRALALGLIGNIFYYWVLAEAVRGAGAPIAGAFTAMIPIIVSVIGNRQAKREQRAVPWLKLMPSLFFILVGMACLNGTEFVYLVGSGRVSSHEFWVGVGFAFLSLFIWTWYPLSNAEWLIKHPQRSPRAWSTAQGLTLLPASLIILGVMSANSSVPAILGPTPGLFIGISLFLGIVSSWVGIFFWNLMSQRLPPALGGQMLIFETLFAVIYAHIWRGQWPSALMVLGMSALLIGIVSGMRVFRSVR